MILFVTIYFCLQLIIAVILWYGARKSKQINTLKTYKNTSVIISLKNESQRIRPLLKSINQCAIKNKDNKLFDCLDFIFVDDHSTDNSYKVVFDELDVKFRYFRLRSTSGKKYAIKHGVEQAKFERILTLDADVWFNDDYLNFLCQTPCSGLTILPVNMTSNSFFGKLSSIEFSFLQRLTFGLAGLGHPYICNGANLLFTKNSYSNSLSYRTDAQIDSGDDVFLLEAIKQANLPITAFNVEDLAVSTLAPIHFKSLLNQRKRWYSKMKGVTTYLGGIFLLTSNVLLLLCLFKLNYDAVYILPVVIKFMSELVSVKEFKQKVWLLPHQIYYPFYLLVLILYPKKNNWRS
ncbi:MAG TPA: glycosyltransferase [Crocinitomix sp.]|nr:glycosyltransferase [Crocinitomix sp.]